MPETEVPGALSLAPTASESLSQDPSKELVSEAGTNKSPIYCPSPGCKCLVLKVGAGQFRAVDPSKTPARPDLPSYNTKTPQAQPPQPAFYWFLTDMWGFENIGFSHAVGGGSLKFLACADCDLGPLGYQDTAVPKEFWLAGDRVRYTLPSGNEP